MALYNPYIDPAEAIRLAKQQNDPQVNQRVRAYCDNIKNKFGDAYKQLGVDLDAIVKEL